MRLAENEENGLTIRQLAVEALGELSDEEVVPRIEEIGRIYIKAPEFRAVLEAWESAVQTAILLRMQGPGGAGGLPDMILVPRLMMDQLDMEPEDVARAIDGVRTLGVILECLQRRGDQGSGIARLALGRLEDDSTEIVQLRALLGMLSSLSSVPDGGGAARIVEADAQRNR